MGAVVAGGGAGFRGPRRYFAFREARYAVLTKIDLLPHLDYDLGRAMSNVLAVNSALGLYLTSTRTGEGLERSVR